MAIGESLHGHDTEELSADAEMHIRREVQEDLTWRELRMPEKAFTPLSAAHTLADGLKAWRRAASSPEFTDVPVDKVIVGRNGMDPVSAKYTPDYLDRLISNLDGSIAKAIN